MVDGERKPGCSYCGISSMDRRDIKRCRLCKRSQCLFHRRPEDHDCEAMEWEEEKGHGELGVMDLLKAGAFVLAVLLIARIAMGTVQGLWGWLCGNLGRAKRIAKANAALFVAVPVSLTLLAGLFPQSAEIVFGAFDGLMGSMDLHAPSWSANDPVRPETNPLGDLRGCVKALSYASTLEDPAGGKCLSLCQGRGHVSYGLVESGNSYDCYCCDGSGKMID